MGLRNEKIIRCRINNNVVYKKMMDGSLANILNCIEHLINNLIPILKILLAEIFIKR